MEGWGISRRVVNRRERPEVPWPATQKRLAWHELIGSQQDCGSFKQVIRVIYPAVPASGVDPMAAIKAQLSEEIIEVKWFDPKQLPFRPRREAWQRWNEVAVANDSRLYNAGDATMWLECVGISHLRA